MKNFQQFAINQEETNNIMGGTTRRERRNMMNQLSRFITEFDDLNLSPETLEQIRPTVQEYYAVVKKYFPTFDQHISEISSKSSFDITSYMSQEVKMSV